MKIIGLTGGIGSGKSTVAGFLAELGAVVLDADKIGHEIFATDAEVRQEIVDNFGKQVLDQKGQINRKKLADVVFKDRESLIKLNLITHPPIYRRLQSILEAYQRQGIEVVVIDAPLLIEAGWSTRVDETWVTIAPKEVIVERLEKRGLKREDVLSRINMQISPEDRMKAAKIVINTNVPLEDLKQAIDDLWHKTTVDTNRR
ncbi:MAG: dephospho-CoA kinase [Dehalococcoidales bacterium]|nr:dephospho-CoA kinase [Dehalococcoidales bacterium]